MCCWLKGVRPLRGTHQLTLGWCELFWVVNWLHSLSPSEIPTKSGSTRTSLGDLFTTWFPSPKPLEGSSWVLSSSPTESRSSRDQQLVFGNLWFGNNFLVITFNIQHTLRLHSSHLLGVFSIQFLPSTLRRHFTSLHFQGSGCKANKKWHYSSGSVYQNPLKLTHGIAPHTPLPAERRKARQFFFNFWFLTQDVWNQ